MDISAEIAAIQAASQGSELRQPLVGALNKLNSGALPAVTSSDAGKILKVGANGWEVGDKSGYMPVPTATKQITQNGTVDVTQYAYANVNVSHSYSAGDEGKVVSNGALVAQTARSSDITENGTYDTTLNNQIVVDIAGGGGVFNPGHFNYKVFKDIGVTHGTATWNDNDESFILTATANDCYTNFSGNNFGDHRKLYVKNGQKVTLKWRVSNNAVFDDKVFMFQNGGTQHFAAADATAEQCSLVVTQDCYITYRFGVANSGNSLTYSKISITIE